MVGYFPEVLHFNRLFLKLNRFICNQMPVLPDHCLELVLVGYGLRNKNSIFLLSLPFNVDDSH